MAWYDTFASFYDRSLENTYLPFRERSFDRLLVGEGGSVLALACGTGQNLPHLAPRVGASGRVFALDLSEGMLAKARARADAAGWSWVETHAVNVTELDGGQAADLGFPGGGFDAVVCTLGLSVVPDWKRVLAASFGLLRPGGQYLVMDVLSERWNPIKPMVEWLARADITRDVSGELEGLSEGFAREAFTDASPWTFGGTLFAAHGRRAK